jgi:PIN domain nuclease of toxin-antitoxin system
VSRYVLDASALLAILNEEVDPAAWTGVVGAAAMSAVNLSEVVGKLADLSMRENEIHDVVGPLGLEIVPFDRELAFLAGTLKAQTRGAGLSLGDRACLALGSRMGLPVLTADRAWARLRLDIEIQVIR